MPHPVPLKSQRFLHRCLSLFSGLLIAGAVVASDRGGLGLSTAEHAILGLAAAVSTVFVHTLAFFYLIETSINIKRAVAQHALDDGFVARHAPLKRRVFPLAFWSMAAVVVAAISGGGVDADALPRELHTGFAIAAVLLTLVSWVVEDRALRDTRAIIAELNQLIRTRVEANPPVPAPMLAAVQPTLSAPHAPRLDAADDDPTQVGPNEALWMIGRWLAFIALSMWILYGYRILVLHQPTPMWPFAGASIPLSVVAAVLILRFRYRAVAERRGP